MKLSRASGRPVVDKIHTPVPSHALWVICPGSGDVDFFFDNRAVNRYDSIHGGAFL
ncbi:MAG: hypothetical protein ABIG70_03075 [Pseudomonadota bacterium]